MQDLFIYKDELIEELLCFGADATILTEIEQNVYKWPIAAGKDFLIERNAEEFGSRLEATGKALAQISPDSFTDERLKAEANLWKRLPSEILALITSYATSAQGPHKLTSDSILAYATKGAKSVISNVLSQSVMRPSEALPVSATGIVYDSDDDSELSTACSASAAFPLRVQKTNLNDPVSVSDVSHLDYHDGIGEAKGYDARSEACSSSSSAAAVFANEGVAEAKGDDARSSASSSSSDTVKVVKSQTAKLEQERRTAKADDGLSK
jgi:hypothetical protein